MLSIDDPAAKLVPGRPITSGSGAVACRATATRWLTSCLETHNACSHRPDNTLPRRVIDVGPPDGDTEPFLFVTDGQKGEWVALSHCWGSRPTFISTTESIDQHRQSLPVAKLPLTYQDAIQITRQLGYQYVWIDSICILQDLRSDWLVESSKMHAIYRDAVLTITASASISGHHGIFASRNLKRNQNTVLVALPCRSSQQDIKGTLNIYKLDQDINEPLNFRAWALQEKALSRRRLIFTSGQMKWTCDTWSASETAPEQLWHADINRQISIFKIPKLQLPRMPDLPVTRTGQDDNGCLAWWYDHLDDYLLRSITFHSDRLPAIAGLAKEVAYRTGYHYKAGLWEEDIHRGLLWEGYGYKVSSNYVPSWSWASIDKGPAPAAFRAAKWLGHLQRYVRGHEAKILQTLVSNAGSDTFGQISAAKLVMNGRYREVTAFKGRPLPYINTQSPDAARLLFVYGDQSLFWNRKHSLPGQIICTFDDVKDITAGGSNLAQRGVIYFQVAKFASKCTGGQNEGPCTL